MDRLIGLNIKDRFNENDRARYITEIECLRKENEWLIAKLIMDSPRKPNTNNKMVADRIQKELQALKDVK